MLICRNAGGKKRDISANDLENNSSPKKKIKLSEGKKASTVIDTVTEIEEVSSLKKEKTRKKKKKKPPAEESKED